MRFGTIRQRVLLDARPIEVYEAYLNPKKHAEFTGQGVTGTPRAGCRFTASDGYIMGKYLELEKGKRILHEWKTTEWPEGYPPSIIELEFKQLSKRTELVMTQTKVPAEQVDMYDEGWKEYYWEPLKEYFRKA